MIAAKLAARAKSTAETAELRNAQGKAGPRNCGITAERLRKHCQVSDLSPSLDPAPCLVRPARPEKSRKVAPAHAPTGRGDAWSNDAPVCQVRGMLAHEQAVIDAALAILAARMRRSGAAFTSPGAVKEYLALQLSNPVREAFGVMYLSTQHELIAFEVHTEGTLAQTSVYPREIVRRALELNAAAVILGHNHPSGVAEPSRADELVTQALRAALVLIDVRVLNHFVVGGGEVVSLAERGLL